MAVTQRLSPGFGESNAPAAYNVRCRSRLNFARPYISLLIALNFVTLRYDALGPDLKYAYIPSVEKVSGVSSKLPEGSSRVRLMPNARAASSQSVRS